ncbi:RimK family alpha-L-glutamate ligase [Streptomyces sp. NPDC087212]|uniref:ATP-grasp domain-containing protein n=1 Tax=Streptomyces sp. NPDC087212 TaxID=3365766 RepID=UPI003815BF4A
MPRIALATYDPGSEPHKDQDLPVLLDALRAAGAEADGVCWDDAEADWAGYDLVVLRSTWDYSWRAAEFMAWTERCGKVTRLANPAEVVRWNTDKRYLGDLAAAGVPVVPTSYLAPGDLAGVGVPGVPAPAPAPTPGGRAASGVPVVPAPHPTPGSSAAAPDNPRTPTPPHLPHDREYVVKPTSGAGARYAARYRPEEREAALRHLARLRAEGLTAMVQPYMRGIDVGGERALQFFGGRLLHASRKRAVLAPGTAYDADKVAHPGLEPWTPTPAELAVAESALAAVPGAREVLYARVDLVDGDAAGDVRVMELELVEPNLFLFLHPGSVTGVRDAILAAARS